MLKDNLETKDQKRNRVAFLLTINDAWETAHPLQLLVTVNSWSPDLERGGRLPFCDGRREREKKTTQCFDLTGAARINYKYYLSQLSLRINGFSCGDV